MMRSIISAAGIGVLVAAASALYFAAGPAWDDSAAAPRAEAAAVAESWPICPSMDFGEGPAWPPLDPEYAAGKRALGAGDWKAAISFLTSVALRDDRNADVQYYLGYAYRRLGQFDLALMHYQRAVVLNPRHRSAHEHLGETYLALGSFPKAEAHLAALERICLIPCGEYGDLKRAFAQYSKAARR
jgi:tetratricopeptide (TPR) repeat protein